MSSRKVPAESLTGSKRAKIENANAGICQFLNELAEYEKNVNRQIHKHNVYRKASRTIAAHPTALQSGKEAQSLPGVGAKIAKKIDEFLSTGKLSKLENIHADPKAQAIQLIASIVGFGPAAASKFVEQGITTLEELRKQDGLTSTQRIGLTYFEDFQKRIPREEVTRLSEQVDSDLRAEVCGSYRRGASSSGDIDILMTHPKFTSEDKKNNKITNKDFAKTLSSVVEAMKDAGFVTDSLSCGETKFMGVCVDLSSDSEQIHRRIDIRFWPFDQYPLGLLYFTGSDELNKEMRRKAIEMGFHLNEYALSPMGEKGTLGAPLPVTCEKDVFDYLDMPFLNPNKR